jgi:alkanesulfonate monooxygenase SsuD/methylene tetrahydromethanopterin reductase-like flavin-dependent oxidoreductase (luciferase family)
MWPDKVEGVKDIIGDKCNHASRPRRPLRFGNRVRVIVRKTETEARKASVRLLSKLDVDEGAAN